MKKYGKNTQNQSSSSYRLSFKSDILTEEDEYFNSYYYLNHQYQRLKKTNEENSNTSNGNLTDKPFSSKNILGKKMQRLSELEASNLYNTLNVSESASQEDIKQSYKKQCIISHPDKGGNPDEFKKLTEAYQILSLPLTRSIFDAFGSRSLSLINAIIIQNKLSNYNDKQVKESIHQGDLDTLAYLFKVNSYCNN